MTDIIENFDAAHNKKLKSLSKEERAKAGLKKLVLELDKNEIPEPKRLVSGKMIVDFEEDYGDE
ncbi:hypothetical protein I6F65_00485 [Pseudoalteromonas sp. SWXJZ94C]|uniref:hypothetical protein n=1 Tax=Pseudoalteromonas sp. SWXJZ94C TaxID=2792065 RepID=UPI0018CD8010|nr:hypothetical protein [Pseudoalteromonas sp. SWXJZ94C]MBH0055432.1 hypothetical protein [Pseudoalteromonas sp. SWXJZ94C]